MAPAARAPGQARDAGEARQGPELHPRAVGQRRRAGGRRGRAVHDHLGWRGPGSRLDLPVADAGGAADGEGGARAGLRGHAGDASLPGVAEDGAVPPLCVHVVEEDELGAAFDDGDGETVAVFVPCQRADATSWPVRGATWCRKGVSTWIS